MLTAIIHFAENGLPDIHFSGVQTQYGFVALMVAIVMLLTGLCTILAPFLGYIPFPVARRLGTYYSPFVVIPWFLIHGILCLFMTGWFGLVVAIFCFLTVVFSIVGIFFKFFASGDDEEN